jgi:hypothetical protein
MDSEAAGLSNGDQIEALADQLSACADALHARLMKSINSGNGGPAIEHSVARALLDDEALLRLRADSLYADGAALAVKGLASSQQHVMQLTADAADKIRKIQKIGDLSSLVAAMLSMAGAVAAGQPAPIMLALERIGHQVQAVAADGAPAA